MRDDVLMVQDEPVCSSCLNLREVDWGNWVGLEEDA